jgi:hypothetical protein
VRPYFSVNEAIIFCILLSGVEEKYAC